MRTRRTVMLAASGIAAAAVTADALAQGAQQGIDYLLVQTARGLAFDARSNKLSLVGISPITLYFSDRPARVAGNMKTDAFVPFWSMGKDSFLKDPPNADVSIIEGNSMRQVIVVLRDPVLEGDILRYTVRAISGEMPAQGADVSVFIDVIGMPWTPVSYAGVARRSFRRAAYWR